MSAIGQDLLVIRFRGASEDMSICKGKMSVLDTDDKYRYRQRVISVGDASFYRTFVETAPALDEDHG